MLRHVWFFFKDNPRVMHSEPHGWEIWKVSADPRLYKLYESDTGRVKPLGQADYWEVLADKADRLTPENG